VEDIRIYTDDKNALMAAVSQSQQRPSATDLVKRTWPEHLNAKARRISQRRKQDARKQNNARAKQEKVLNTGKIAPVEKIAPVPKEKIVPPEIKQKKYYGMSL